jgi:hypothetical protein
VKRDAGGEDDRFLSSAARQATRDDSLPDAVPPATQQSPSHDARCLCDTLVVRYKPGVWVLTLLIAAVCGITVWGVVLFRTRPLSPAALMRRIPARDTLLVYVDFAALRQAGILQLLDNSKIGEEPEYQAFVRQTEFDYKQDLDRALIAFAPTGKYMLLAGRFDWTSIHSYVTAAEGECYNSFCKLGGSTPDRHISFFPLRKNLMAMAVSPDDSAALRLQVVAPGPPPEVPSAPVWLSIPASVLLSPDALPGGTGALAGDIRGADRVTLAFTPDAGRVAAHLDVRCRSEQDAAAIARQLSRTTGLLRDAIIREHHQPNPADFSGVLAAGAFRSQGTRVLGYWPIERSFLENLLGGG